MAKKKSSPKVASKKSRSVSRKKPTKKSGIGSVSKSAESPPLASSDSAGEETAFPQNSSAAERCVVVGIGASAGGLESYKRFLRYMPDDTGMAFVLVQHLDPTHESMMVELLSKYTSMPVLQAGDAMPVQPNHVYMIPPNKFIKIMNGGLFLETPITNRGIRLPIDYFFRSLAESRKERSICVVLSGTGSDGADGLREVKGEGGMTVVQHPDDAEYDGMPRAAISTGAVDFIKPIEAMAEVIVPYASHPYVQSQPTVTLAESAPDHFRAILSLLRAHTDQDFSRYKKGTLNRRIERRMGIRHINQPEEYLKLLRQDTDEVRALFKDLLIGVTRFFRETSAWDDLSDILGRRMLQMQNEEPFRIWVPGCSTGEEAYSLALVMFEQQERQNRRFDIQIFGTDIDADAIESARLGIYPDGITKDVKDVHIDQFFVREGEKLRVKKKLRETCIFAVQNLLSDPPFSNLDLVSCRNLLIYLEPDIQQRVFDMIHFALKPGGLLALGSSESPGQRKKLFKTISQTSRIYRKVGESKPGAAGFPVDGSGSRQKLRPLHADNDGPLAPIGTVELSKNALLDQFAPASVVVDHRGAIQFIHGPVRQYLDFPTGEPDLDLVGMALEGLKAKTRQALQQSRNTDDTVIAVAPRVRRDGKTVTVRVQVRPIQRAKRHDSLYLVSFFDESEPEKEQMQLPTVDQDALTGQSDGQQKSGEPTGRDQQLLLELQATREDLQSTIEEVESANEELKASNEEVMSMNEELQSTNEELETSREELQSLNEELSTVNNQLHDKVAELESTNNDLTNLLSSTDVATLFLDSELRIRRYTPATVRLMNLIDGDVGRPLSDLAPRVNDPDLETDAINVLRQLVPIEKEVRNGGQHWFTRRITPFRTSENKIEGVVVTFSDVTRLKEALRRIEYREKQQAVVAQLGKLALSGESLSSLFDRAARDVAETLDVEFSKLLRLTSDRKRLLLRAGVGWRKGLVGKATVPCGIDSQAGYTLQTAAPIIVTDLRSERRFSGPKLLTDHDVISGISVVIGPEDSPWGVLGAHTKRLVEFTVDDANFVQSVANVVWEAIARRRSESTVAHQLTEINSLYDSSPIGLCYVDTELRYVRINDQLAAINGLAATEHLGKSIREVLPELADTVEPIYRQVIETGQPAIGVEISGTRPGEPNTVRHWLVSYAPHQANGEVLGVNAMVLDITKRKRAETALIASQDRLRKLVASASVGITFAKQDGTVLQANDAALTIFGISRQQFQEVGWDWRDRVLPEDEVFAEQMNRLGRDTSKEPVELRRKDSKGATVWVLASARPLDDVSGEYVAFLVDITNQKRAELKLSESEERLRLAAQMAGFGTYYGDVKQGKLTWSPELKRIFGLDSEDPEPVAIGEVPGLVHEDDRDRVAEKLRASLDPSGDGQFQDEHRIARSDGSVRWLLMQGQTIFKGTGDTREPVRIAGVVLDITRRHQYEEELQKARTAAEAANEAKSQFLANMSHEIRTPMTAILGYADVLQGRLDDPDARACVQTIRDNGDYLCEILNDILDLSKIESGKLVAHPESCDLLAILSNIRSLLSVRANEKDLELSIELDGEIPKVIQTDPKLFRQILVNLVGNAVKFTDQGIVRVVAKCLTEDELLQISVIDTGVGISQYDLEKLFQPFEQADNSNTRQVGGTGLGLSISKKLVETLGGQLEVESALGEGATFRFTVKTGSLDSAEWVGSDDAILEDADTSLATETLPTLDGRILAVDDRRDIRFLVKSFLASAGATLVTCEDGAQGLEAWKAAQDQGEAIDAVLMDMQMPVMDGLAATRKLRQQGYAGPIIALTASAMHGDREACLQAGCNDFVSKPIDRSELILKLAAWMNKPG